MTGMENVLAAHGIAGMSAGTATSVGTVRHRGTHIERFFAKVQKTETCWLWTGKPIPKGYGRIWVDGRTVMAHRVSYELHVGPIPDGKFIDHICRIPRCVNPSHLRVVTNKENQENRPDPLPGNKSGIRGVYWKKARRKWIASVRHNDAVHWLGGFDSVDEANAAVVAKRLELYTHNDFDRHDTTNPYPAPKVSET